MRAATIAILALLAAACTTPLRQGERLYREGDRLGALETWREIPDDASDHQKARQRIGEVEAEFERLVVQYKQRGRYYEDKKRLAESILNYRLALELQPGDNATLDHVQGLARTLASDKATRKERYRSAFEAGDLREARRQLEGLRQLDPFDPQLETDQHRLNRALRAEIDRRMTAGRLAFSAGDHAAATGSFGTVLDLDPHNESARGYLSYIDTIRREREKARREDVAFAPPPGFASDAEIRAEGFYQNALRAERAGNRYAAIRYDMRALGADPSHRGAGRQLARLRRELAAKVDALMEAGRIAFRAEDLQSALDAWRRALLIEPDNERILAYVGRAEQQLENLERLRAEPDVANRKARP
jgi:tetratricopeptide (TPR) repeat protein